MYQRYFSFSGTVTKEEYKSLIMSGLKFYGIFVLMILIPVFLMDLSRTGEAVVLQVVIIGSIVFVWSVCSIISRFFNGLKVNKK